MINIIDINTLIDIYPQIPFTHKALEFTIAKNFSSIKEDINIVFVKGEYIQELNKEYREKDEITDVLSFNISSDNVLGEVYICPEYVIKRFTDKNFSKEILRLTIHGILHLQGEDHKEKFNDIDYKNEPMYIKQEKILNKILKDLKIS